MSGTVARINLMGEILGAPFVNKYIVRVITKSGRSLYARHGIIPGRS